MRSVVTPWQTSPLFSLNTSLFILRFRHSITSSPKTRRFSMAASTQSAIPVLLISSIFMSLWLFLTSKDVMLCLDQTVAAGDDDNVFQLIQSHQVYLSTPNKHFSFRYYITTTNGVKDEIWMCWLDFTFLESFCGYCYRKRLLGYPRLRKFEVYLILVFVECSLLFHRFVYHVCNEFVLFSFLVLILQLDVL